jgi:N-acetylmuramoyl-L-alanine amidase
MNFTIKDARLRFPRRHIRRLRTEHIVIHHLDAHWDVHRTHAYHQSLGWNGIGYNLHVAMDGTITLGRGIEIEGVHTVGLNSRSIGIGCEGRYHSVDRLMPDIQFNALVWLIKHLHEIYGNIPVIGHRDYVATSCPGQFFPLQEVQTLQFRQDANSNVQQNLSSVSSWAKEAWEDAVSKGIVDGTNPGAFATREQVVVIISRFLKSLG